MDNAELKGLPRRVGQMTYEQVRALLDENRQQIRAHNRAEGRGDFCPQCVWHVERRYARCAEQDTMLDAYRALSGLDPSAEAAILAITRHQATCPTCQTVAREWKHVDSCAARSQLHEIERVYAHQMLHLEMQERRRDRSSHENVAAASRRVQGSRIERAPDGRYRAPVDSMGPMPACEIPPLTREPGLDSL
jgi:hypothetical protein